MASCILITCDGKDSSPSAPPISDSRANNNVTTNNSVANSHSAIVKVAVNRGRLRKICARYVITFVIGVLAAGITLIFLGATELQSGCTKRAAAVVLNATDAPPTQCARLFPECANISSGGVMRSRLGRFERNHAQYDAARDEQDLRRDEGGSFQCVREFE